MHTFQARRNLGERAARPACRRCLRPLAHCLCSWIPSLGSRTRVLVLQHPEEARHALNTARLAVLGLRNASLHVGRHFDADLWQVAGYQPWLLFPGEGAEVLAPADAADPAQAPPRLLVVPDGTWRHARQLLAAHPGLAALPRATLADGQLSRYRVRHAGHPQALATIEAVAAALDALEAPHSFVALLKPFEILVAGQIAAMGQERYQRDHVRRAGSRAAKCE
ncbi:tRNA-uridine aminocarboxypropyltransferase [Bordetella sp. BOR01]|uniref:tRNA-uridine aminocarboxypropyltransferase n=1 Tax=Bordetella sp. BOR01 TaxID=2854779 RepID=UPI001C491BFA|nr:DTW domain-containing protein [Bordetella sp. BOR01]MBV7485731.1 DTW domain-containing protein [Bordetella sp. BOR01]